MRAPWNDTLYEIFKELYSAEEADLIVRMPYGLADFQHIATATGYEPARLHKLLDGLCAKGLVMDLWVRDAYWYMISPLVIGIFEFTLMRTGDDRKTKEWARLFHTYLQQENTFIAANFKHGERISPLRALPYEGTVEETEFVEVLDYEKATAIIEQARRYAIGLCSCRHEKLHVGEKKCAVPLDTCSSFDTAADYLLRHNFAKEVSKTEMLENLARSREFGLVLCADNVRQDVSFICHCCGCCCNVLQGITRCGFPNALVTSNYLARIDRDNCLACGVCAETCPIQAITAQDDGRPTVDEERCLGCGVCALSCSTGSLKLAPRQQRVFHPETTFERVILQCLERGTLQNMFFVDPQKITHKFMRGFVGGFLRLPPVKKALMGETLRSSFLNALKSRAGQ
jgi:Pyruvate/2-oxoacid:ferredoxin oxidoreductase delta subunit